MDLSWLADLQALADSGSFSRAAEARHMTQPAFSRRIRALEDWAGVGLVERAGRPVALTEAGRCLLPVADLVLRAVRDGRDAARAAGRSEAATLRFAATHALSFGFFPGWLGRLGGRLPAAALQLLSDSLQACERHMLDGQAQFLLCHHHPAAPGRLPGALFRSLRIGLDRLCLVASPGLLDAAGAGAALPRLAYGAESGLGRIVAAVRPDEAEAAPAVTSHLAAALRAMARDGRGAAWLPLSLVAPDLADASLRRAAPDADDIETAILLYRRAAPLPANAERLWDGARDAGALPA